MLLRIILTEADIRRITIDNIPENINDFHSIIKAKLGLDLDIVIQYQDPDFDNDLCNLTCMSDLPKDKATLKVHIKTNESYHTDSTLDTASLSSSSLDEGPSGTKTRQLPQPFIIPSFSFDVELNLKKGNEAFHRDGTLLDTSKNMKSDILDKLAEAIYAHNPYPTREEYDQVAQALIEKHPCLKEPGSVHGWYCWKFSLKFKMGNFRQKMRVAGCSEVGVNARGSGPPLKRLKRAKKSEINFLPGFPEGKSESDLERDRSAMVVEMTKRKVDWKQIGEMMNITFSLRRKEIVEDEPLVAEVKERWPALFKEQQIEAEFARLTSVDLKNAFFNGLDQYLPRFLELFKAKDGKIAALTRLMKCLDDDSSMQRKRSVFLLGLPHFLKDDPSSAFKTVQATDEEATFTRGIKVGVVMVKDGEDVIATSVVLEEQVVLPDVKDIPHAIALLMGLLFALNIDYPKELRYTFEVIQKVLMNIGGGQCSSLVHGLRNRLLRKTT